MYFLFILSPHPISDGGPLQLQAIQAHLIGQRKGAILANIGVETSQNAW